MLTGSRSLEPRVSLVMPTFRRPQLLKQALDSVVAQTYGQFEALVCDNANDPTTAALVHSYHDPRIVYVPREHNLGMLGNVRDGFSRTRGSYVMELDDDDVLEPRALESMARALDDHPTAALAFGRYATVAHDGSALSDVDARRARFVGWDTLPLGPVENVTRLSTKGAIQTYAALFRRDHVVGVEIPDEVGTAFDAHLKYVAASTGAPAVYVGGPVMRFRLHAGAETTQRKIEQLRGSLASIRLAEARGGAIDLQAMREVRQIVEEDLLTRLIGAGARTEAQQLLAESALPLSHRLPFAVGVHMPFRMIRPLRSARARLRSRPTYREGSVQEAAPAEPNWQFTPTQL